MQRIILITLIAIIAFSKLSGIFAGNGELVSFSAESGPETTAEQALSRGEQEEMILASTVRIQMHGWTELKGHLFAINRGGKSHATIIDGRHMVTHNHFTNPFQALEQGGYTGMSLFDANGQLLAENISLDNITVVAEQAEMLVIEVTDGNGNGLFESLALPAAEMNTFAEMNLQAGMEVAQIDWDGNSSHIDWVTIESVELNGGTPRIELDNYVEKGASGGGVFFNGVHIGNNWSHLRDRDSATGTVTREYSKVALNSGTRVAAADGLDNS